MHSPDRRYWWTGSQWQLAVSSDGMWWFDGQRWVPNPLGPPRRRRDQTKWTRPLQAAVIVLLVLSLVPFAVGIPLVASTPLPPAPPGTPPEYAARLDESFRAFVVTTAAVEGLFFLVWGVLTVIGTLKRWTWMFWVILVVVGLSIFLSATDLLLGVLSSVGSLTTTPPLGFTVSPGSPLVITAEIPAVNLLRVALFVGMLVLGIRIGPWACREAVDE